MGTFLIFISSLLCGYYLALVVSHPKHRKGSLPSVRFKNVEILPNVRIHIGGKTYWFHHWAILSVLLVVMFIAYDSFQHFMLLKGAALGGVFQGLRYSDRFKFRHPRILR